MAGRYTVTVYGRWGSEPYGSYATLDKAKEKAKMASSLEPERNEEFVVEWGEPGGGNAIVYKNGKRVGGEGDRGGRRRAVPARRRAVKKRITSRRRVVRRRRDVSRADLRHLSGAALLKLLRQAVRKGDEDMAEAIGKELDRRGEGFRRTGRDEVERDSPKKVRTLVALLPVHAGSYHVIAYTRSSSAGHISTKKLGSYRSKAKGKAHLNRARTAMRGKKGRGIGFVDATSMKHLPFSRMLQRRLAPYRKARA